MNVHFNSTPMMAHSGYLSHINDDCIACGACVKFCQFSAIIINEMAVLDQDKCMGCGICVDKCKSGAIELNV